MQLERFNVNASLLERWLLKTLINITIDSPYKIGPNAAPASLSSSLVNIAMGNQKFEGHGGMYVAGYTGMDMVMDDTLTFSPLIREDETIIGGTFVSGGMRLMLNLDPMCPPSVLTNAQGLEREWAVAPLKRPFEKLLVKNGKYLSHIIHFRWSGPVQVSVAK